MRTLAPIVAGLVAGITAVTLAEDWPQLQHDPGHTGYTADRPSPPLRLKWARTLGEPTHTGSPPIVADGKVFVGTNWGNLLALDRASGETLWTYRTEAPIVSTPAFDSGVVYAASMDRRLHAVGAKAGKALWTFETEEGLWAGPVVAEGKVFIAGRDALVYALDCRTGGLLWKSAIGAMVMSTPAYDEGVLYVGAGDNHVYAFDAAGGKQRWKSAKLPGMAIRDYWLVAAGGNVIVTTQLVYNSHQTCRMIERAIMRPFMEKNHGKMLVQDELLRRLVDWYRQHPHQKTFHVLSAATGKEKFIAPIVSVHGGGCTGPLPVIAPDGYAYLIYANVRLCASGWAFPGRLDLDNGKLEPLIKGRYWIDKDQWEWQPKPGTQFSRQSTFAVGFCVTDQSWGVSMGGDRLLTVRDPGWPTSEGAYCYLNLKTREDRYLTDRRTAVKQALRDGCFGGAFHATASPMVVSGKNVFHKAVRNVILCFEGN